MQDLTEALKLIEDNKKLVDFEALDDETQIIAAEKILGLKFSQTYKLFLKNYGCGDIGSTEVYGLINGNPNAEGIPNVVWITMDDRKKYSLPKAYIRISDTGDGYSYVLDSSQPNKDGEYPVLIYGFGDQEKAYEDFGEFLLDQVKQAIAMEEEDDS